MIKLDEIYQRRAYKTLDDIFASERTGLLDNVQPITSPSSSSDLLEQQFLAINGFVDRHGQPPDIHAPSFDEKILARQLQSMQRDKAKVKALLRLDRHGLLKTALSLEDASDAIDHSIDIDNNTNGNRDYSSHSAVSNTFDNTPIDTSINTHSNAITSIDDILNNDELGLFADIATDILIYEDKTHNGASPRGASEQFAEEEIASRYECKDFYKFEATFERIYHAIKLGAFNKSNFSSIKDINVGSVFVLNGMLCYVAKIYKSENRKSERNQHRLRLIFANGTESNMLIRSLATAQYKYENSYQLLIIDPDWMNDDFGKGFGDARLLSGVIYVARLVNPPDNLKHYQHLHKIGFSTLTGEMRTKHAIHDTAFLQQSVELVAEWEVYDANARSVEGILHAFFFEQRVKVSSKAADNQFYRATEWFNVPLAEIQKALSLVISGDIKHYRMDAAAGRILPI